MKHIDFRCDAGARHGLGHLSRCLGIAEAMGKLGYQCRFIIHAPPEILERVESAGHKVHAVSKDAGTENPAGWYVASTSVLLIDSKEVSAAYVEDCRSGYPVVCFDDELLRDLPCDAIINNNLWAREQDYAPREGRELWLGPSFNTIKSDYFEIANNPRDGLLISMGGEDPHDHTSWLIENLAETLQTMPVNICIGPVHPDPDHVIAVCQKMLPSAVICRAPVSLIEPVSHCHVALTAGGTTCYELAAAGVAMAVLASESHQQAMLNSMTECGAALSLGTFETLSAEHANQVLNTLLEVERIEALEARSRQLFGASGIQQIAEKLDEMVGNSNRGSVPRDC